MDLDSILKSFLPEIIRLRRQIHSAPELPWQETQTQLTVEAFLKNHGYETRRVAGTGLIADLSGTAVAGTRPRTLAIRADLDALPVQEDTGLDFASKTPGVMHACGHDVHAAVVAGLAAVMARIRDDLPGRVRFMFQPAEEGGSSRTPGVDPFKTIPVSRRGAERMMDDGALDGVDAIVGAHTWPELPVGAVGVDPKTAMAGNATLRIRIKGRGGHGAMPHRAIDPVPVAASLVLALQTIASRRSNPANPFVLTIGSLHAGTAASIIPETAELMATLRSSAPGYLDKEIPEVLRKMVHGIVEGAGAQVDMAYAPGLPPSVNDAALVDAFLASASRTLGRQNAILLDEVSMTSEDFAYYAEAVPAVYVKVGVAGKDGSAPLHNPHFNPDERSIEVAIRVLAGFALDFLRS